MAQRQVLSAIEQAIADEKATEREALALKEAGIVESHLTQLSGGDRDSTGFLQQRPSQGWGPVGESAYKDAVQFLRAAKRVNRAGFHGSAGELAQAVQRSAFPGRYDAVRRQAVGLGGRGGGTSSRRSSAPLSAPTSRFDAQGFSKAQLRAQILTGLLSHGNPNTHNPLVRFGLLEPKRADFTRTTPGTRTGATSRSPAAVAAPTAKGTFRITGSNPGRLKPSVIQFAKRVAAIYGQPITGDSGATHSKYTATGGLSQHWTGNATDIPARGRTLLRLGRAALIAAGMPRKQAMRETGGLYNFKGGIQVIFNDRKLISGSPHDDHLHISHG